MRLSTTLGIDVEEIEEWPMDKVTRYYAHYLNEPFGIEWWWLSQLTNVIANCLGRGKNAPPYERESWYPFQVRQDAGDMHQQFFTNVLKAGLGNASKRNSA